MAYLSQVELIIVLFMVLALVIVAGGHNHIHSHHTQDEHVEHRRAHQVLQIHRGKVVLVIWNRTRALRITLNTNSFCSKILWLSVCFCPSCSLGNTKRRDWNAATADESIHVESSIIKFIEKVHSCDTNFIAHWYVWWQYINLPQAQKHVLKAGCCTKALNTWSRKTSLLGYGRDKQLKIFPKNNTAKHLKCTFLVMTGQPDPFLTDVQREPYWSRSIILCCFIIESINHKQDRAGLSAHCHWPLSPPRLPQSVANDSDKKSGSAPDPSLQHSWHLSESRAGVNLWKYIYIYIKWNINNWDLLW